MPGVCRVGDKAQCPLDVHGNPCCPHPSVSGPATAGSPDVFIEGRPILRMGDAGVHTACCGPNTWTAVQGSAKVYANNIPVVRMGDFTRHCGGAGFMIEGSPLVHAD